MDTLYFITHVALWIDFFFVTSAADAGGNDKNYQSAGHSVKPMPGDFFGTVQLDGQAQP